MLKRLAFIALFVAALAASGTGGSPARALRQSGVASEGIGLDDIKIGESTKKDVIASYGKDFELNEYNKYSYSLNYKSGLSFYYCYKDPEEKIFLIEVESPSKVRTGKGIVAGKSTLQDVFNLYGKVELDDRAEAVAEYYGIQFYFKVPYDPEDLNDAAKIERMLPLKVASMQIMSPLLSSNFCDEFGESQMVTGEP